MAFGWAGSGRRWWATAGAAAGALVLAGMAFAAGIPQVHPVAARDNAMRTTDRVVSGGVPRSAFEASAGQLPEVPWAAALPFALAVPGLIGMMKKRRGQVT